MVQKAVTTVTESRITTIVGYLTVLLGILLPGDTGKTCLEAVTNSNMPLASGAILGLGALLLGVGPSLKQKA